MRGSISDKPADRTDLGKQRLRTRHQISRTEQRGIDRIQRSIRQTTRDLDRLIALRAKSEAKAEKAAKAPHREVTEQSQFPTPLQREQANWRKQIE